jgi:hypothetical protein
MAARLLLAIGFKTRKGTVLCNLVDVFLLLSIADTDMWTYFIKKLTAFSVVRVISVVTQGAWENDLC